MDGAILDWLLATGAMPAETASRLRGQPSPAFLQEMSSGVALALLGKLLAPRLDPGPEGNVDSRPGLQIQRERNARIFVRACKHSRITVKFRLDQLERRTNFDGLVATLKVVSERLEAVTKVPALKKVPAFVEGDVPQEMYSKVCNPYYYLGEEERTYCDYYEQHIAPNPISASTLEQVVQELIDVERRFGNKLALFLSVPDHKLFQSKPDSQPGPIRPLGPSLPPGAESLPPRPDPPPPSPTTSLAVRFLSEMRPAVLVLLALHDDIAAGLVRALNERGDVGRVLADNKTRLVAYAPFSERCTNFARYLDTLGDEAFAEEEEKIKAIQIELNHKNPIQIKELFRICAVYPTRYNLLLKELLKQAKATVQKGNSDLDWAKHLVKTLPNAIEEMHDFVTYLNEYQRDSEALVALKAELDRIKFGGRGGDVAERRKCLQHGSLVFQTKLSLRFASERTIKATFPTRYLFCFRRMLLICNCTQSSDSVEGLRAFKIFLTSRIQSVRHDASTGLVRVDVTNDASSLDDSCSFEIKVTNDTKQEKEANAAELEREFNRLKELADIRSPSHSGPGELKLAEEDDRVVTCDACGKLLHGRMTLGIYCPTCKGKFHEECYKAEPVFDPSKLVDIKLGRSSDEKLLKYSKTLPVGSYAVFKKEDEVDPSLEWRIVVRHAEGQAIKHRIRFVPSIKRLTFNKKEGSFPSLSSLVEMHAQRYGFKHNIAEDRVSDTDAEQDDGQMRVVAQRQEPKSFEPTKQKERLQGSAANADAPSVSQPETTASVSKIGGSKPGAPPTVPSAISKPSFFPPAFTRGASPIAPQPIEYSTEGASAIDSSAPAQVESDPLVDELLWKDCGAPEAKLTGHPVGTYLLYCNASNSAKNPYTVCLMKSVAPGRVEPSKMKILRFTDPATGQTTFTSKGRTYAYDSVTDLIESLNKFLLTPLKPPRPERPDEDDQLASESDSESSTTSDSDSGDDSLLPDKLSFFVGTRSADEAAQLLERQPLGTYLLRRNEDGFLRISYLASTAGRSITKHIIVEENKEDGSFGIGRTRARDIRSLIRMYHKKKPQYNIAREFRN